jgi:hypothetical protein
MHRMGPGNAKLVAFEELYQSLQVQAPRIERLQHISVWDVPSGAINAMTDEIWQVIEGLKVGVGLTKIVSGSKALHHVLPALVPPIDREYTVQFFLHHKTFAQGDERAFRLIYPRFISIANDCRSQIQQVLGTDMNTSATKVIDNAIVGYVLRNIKATQDGSNQ